MATMDYKELMAIIKKYIVKHGTIITNQNLDYIVEQAIKEYGNEEK